MQFDYPAGSLGFSVVIYLTCACVAIFVLLVRRKMSMFGKAELGGPVKAKWATGFIVFILWLLYIVVSSLEAYDLIEGF